MLYSGEKLQQQAGRQAVIAPANRRSSNKQQKQRKSKSLNNAKRAYVRRRRWR